LFLMIPPDSLVLRDWSFMEIRFFLFRIRTFGHFGQWFNFPFSSFWTCHFQICQAVELRLQVSPWRSVKRCSMLLDANASCWR
jgi:hypothetical protein